MHWLSGPRGKWTFANSALLAFIGAQGRAILRDPWSSIVHENDRAFVMEAVTAALRARQPFKVECRVLAGGGDVRWCALHGNPRVQNGRFIGFAGSLSDVTPRTYAQHVAREQALRFRVLSETIDQVCISIDENGEILSWNPAAERLTGIGMSGAVGRAVYDLFPALSPASLQNEFGIIRAGGARGRLVLPVPARGKSAGLECAVIPCGRMYMLHETSYAAAVEDAGETVGANLDGSEVAVVPGAEIDVLRILACADDLITFQDTKGQYLFATGGVRSSLSPHDFPGRVPGQIFPPEVARLLMERHSTVLATADHLSAEWSMVRDAATTWFRDHLSPVRTADGTPAGVVTISRNITAQRRAEERLRESEERYRRFVENSNEGIWRWETREPIPTSLPEDDQIRQILEFCYVAECNPPVARLYGYARTEEMVGVVLRRVLHGDDDAHRELLRQFIQSGYCLSDIEVAHADRGGRPRHTLHNLVGTIEHGSLVRAWGSVRDITDTELAERRLRLLAHTITSTRDSVSITDLDDRILYVNDAFLIMYGYPEEDLLGNNIAMVRHADGDPALMDRISSSTREGGWNGELINRRADGSLFPVELWTSTVHNDEGEPVAMVGVARDITQRKQAEEELRTSLREKEVLLKEIHHRVKNNLQVISSLLSLQAEYLKDEQMVKALKESQNRVRSMALIHEKLYQSRNLAEIDFSDYVRELTSQLIRSYGIGAHGISLNVQASQVLLAVDRAIPCGIIVNELVTNALKYAFPDNEGGRIDVELQPVESGRIRLAVRDNGVGLPANLDFDTSDSLGLTLVRMLADQVQGTISVHAGEPGAEFVLTFRK